MAQSRIHVSRPVVRYAMVMLLLAATAGAAYWYGGWRAERQRLEVMLRPPLKVDLALGKLPAGSAPLIDGREDRDRNEWGHAVRVPFEGGHESRFAWDEQALYGCIQGYDGIGTPNGDIRVLLGSKRRAVRLEYGRSLRPTTTAPAEGFNLRYGVVFDSESGRVSWLPEGAVESQGFVFCIKTGEVWDFEFRLPWAVMGVSSPDSENVSVQVYRVQAHPSGHMAIMEPSGQKR